MKEQTDTSEDQTDVFARIVVSLESKKPVMYHYGHTVLEKREPDRWDKGFPGELPKVEPYFFPAKFSDVSLDRQKYNQSAVQSEGKSFWIVKHKPVPSVNISAEDEEVIKDVVRHMQIEFSEDLDEQVALIERYYQWVLALRARREELKMTDEEVTKKISKLILFLHDDKCIQFTSGLSAEAKETYKKAIKIFIDKHKGMGGFLRTLRK